MLIFLPFLFLPIFIVLVVRGPLWLARAFVVAGVLFLLAAGLYAFYAFGGAFGPGVLVFCFAALAFPVALLIWIVARRPVYRRVGDDKPRRNLFRVGGLLLVFLQLSPILGYFTIRSACFSRNKMLGAPIVAAVEGYYQDVGADPEVLSRLIPAYLAEIPQPACLSISGALQRWADRFELEQCPAGVTLLTVPSADGASIQRYNFSTGRWSSISFLDGACSHLP